MRLNQNKLFINLQIIANLYFRLLNLSIHILNIREEYPLSKISLVFGCGGNRDKDKRSIMGAIASKYCDKIYLTDDNPRLENPKLIRNQIKWKFRVKSNW